VEDLLDRIVEDVSWCRGLEAVWERNCLLQLSSDEATKSHGKMLIDSALDFQDVLKEREQIGRKNQRFIIGLLSLFFCFLMKVYVITILCTPRP
jgi:hypothetical protein